MNAQEIILGERVAHVRELKTEVAKLKAELAELRARNGELENHLDLAILAAADLRELGADGRLVIVDGWNLILGAKKEARDRNDLIEQAKKHLEKRPQDFVWIVLDGADRRSTVEGRIRVSYTGGSGPHRADRLICDYLRMAVWRGDLVRLEVRTNDKDFRREVERIIGTAGGNLI